MTDARMPPPEDADSPVPPAPEIAPASPPAEEQTVSSAGAGAPPDERGGADAAPDPRSLSERSETKRPAGTEGPDGAASLTPAPQVEPASPDIDIVAASSMLPGSHRGGFFRLPTAPIAVTVQSAPTEPSGELTPTSAQWLASDEPQIHKGLAGWALAFAIIGLAVSLFVGWGFPIGLVAVVSAVFALRRPLENRAMAVWAIAIGAVSILYSAGWLLYAAMRANFFG